MQAMGKLIDGDDAIWATALASFKEEYPALWSYCFAQTEEASARCRMLSLENVSSRPVVDNTRMQSWSIEQ